MKKIYFFYLLSLIFFSPVISDYAQENNSREISKNYGTLFTKEVKVKEIDLNQILGKYKGSFLLYDFKKNEYKQYNPKGCSQRYSPCSTFKIVNSLIGFETGAVPDTNFVIPYDSTLNPVEPWMRSTEPFKNWMKNNSIKDAFRYSSVWYYQELARRIGKENMQKYINLLGYGNEDISSGIDNFWLCGSIQIAAFEQVEFLKKLYKNELNGISERSINFVKSIMLAESNNEYNMYAKTGTGDCSKNEYIGWYVGFVERKDNVYVFAMNMFADSFNDIKENRIPLVKEILNKLKVIN